MQDMYDAGSKQAYGSVFKQHNDDNHISSILQVVRHLISLFLRFELRDTDETYDQSIIDAATGFLLPNVPA